MHLVAQQKKTQRPKVLCEPEGEAREAPGQRGSRKPRPSRTRLETEIETTSRQKQPEAARKLPKKLKERREAPRQLGRCLRREKKAKRRHRGEERRTRREKRRQHKTAAQTKKGRHKAAKTCTPGRITQTHKHTNDTRTHMHALRVSPSPPSFPLPTTERTVAGARRQSSASPVGERDGEGPVDDAARGGRHGRKSRATPRSRTLSRSMRLSRAPRLVRTCRPLAGARSSRGAQPPADGEPQRAGALRLARRPDRAPRRLATRKRAVDASPRRLWIPRVEPHRLQKKMESHPSRAASLHPLCARRPTKNGPSTRSRRPRAPPTPRRRGAPGAVVPRGNPDATERRTNEAARGPRDEPPSAAQRA